MEVYQTKEQIDFFPDVDAELLLYQIFFNDDIVMGCGYHVFGISFWHWYDYNMLLFVESRNRDIISYLKNDAEGILSETLIWGRWILKSCVGLDEPHDRSGQK